MKHWIFFITLIIVGTIFLYGHDQLLQSIADVSDGTFLTVQADPPKKCESYTGQCTVRGYVLCQDEGGTKYPISGAKMHLAVPAVKWDWYTNTNADGFFDFNPEEKSFGVIAGTVTSVETLPDKSLPTGQSYLAMKKPPKKENIRRVGKTGWSGTGADRYYVFTYSGCSPEVTAHEDPVSPYCDGMRAEQDDEEGIVHITAFAKIAKEKAADNPFKITLRVEKDGTEIASSPLLTATLVPPEAEEEESEDARYQVTWTYTFPKDGRGYVVYRVFSEIQPEAGINLMEPLGALQGSGIASALTGAWERLFPASIGEILQSEPSLKLSTFFPPVMEGSCEEILLPVKYE